VLTEMRKSGETQLRNHTDNETLNLLKIDFSN
jgi:hypothetical protein